jgi:hypothetical protein
MVLQLFATRGNQLYLEFWAVTGDLQYPGYKTPTIAPEPSVERVVENVLLPGGRIGTHMLLQALPRYWAVRLWSYSLHNFNWESRCGTHHVDPKDVSEVKAQVEAKFHMYCFVLC